MIRIQLDEQWSKSWDVRLVLWIYRNADILLTAGICFIFGMILGVILP